MKKCVHLAGQQGGVGGEDILGSVPIGNAADDHADGNPRVFDTRLPVVYGGVNYNPMHPTLTFHIRYSFHIRRYGPIIHAGHIFSFREELTLRECLVLCQFLPK